MGDGMRLSAYMPQNRFWRIAVSACRSKKGGGFPGEESAPPWYAVYAFAVAIRSFILLSWFVVLTLAS